MKKIIFILLITTNVTFANETKKLNVFVSILPQLFFVEKIAKDKVNVNVLVKPGESPEAYNITPNQMKLLANTDIFFSIGIPFEEIYLPKIKPLFKKITIIKTHNNIKLKLSSHCCHDSKHSHKGYDPHIWLSPNNAKIIAENILDSLIENDVSNKEFYLNNFKILMNELDDINNYIKNMLSPFKGKSIIVFHPAFGYFLDDFGLNQIAVEKDGSNPKSKDLIELINIGKKEQIKTIFIQPQFSKHAALQIATELNANIEEIDPLSKDYIENLKDIANKIKDSYRKNVNI